MNLPAKRESKYYTGVVKGSEGRRREKGRKERGREGRRKGEREEGRKGGVEKGKERSLTFPHVL